MNGAYDVIVVGAGISGLICGAKLSKEGFSVLVLEKNSYAGGCICGVRKKDFYFDYGAHLFGSLSAHGIFKYYLDSLNVKDLDFIRISPSDRYFFSDEKVEIPEDLDEYVEMLKTKFPTSSRRINSFFREVIQIARSYSSEKKLSRFYDLKFIDLVRKHFSDIKLIGVLMASFSYLGIAPGQLGATSMSLMMISYLRDGTFYPKGGTQAIPDAFVRGIKNTGGEIKLCEEVRKICIVRDNVKLITTSKKNQYSSKAVVIASDVRRAFSNIIDCSKLPAGYLSFLKKLKVGPSFFTMYLGLNKINDLSEKCGWYHSSYNLEANDESPFYAFSPSCIDNSLVASDKSVLQLAMPFYEENTSEIDWEKRKYMFQIWIWKKICEVMPHLREQVLYEEVSSPSTIEKFTFNTNGSMCGWEMSPQCMHLKRLYNKTPIEGVYLAGHWTNPGGGVAPSATSGWIAAEQVREYISLLMQTR
ncbi:MAG: NAD(P)/FAD-dependent oxidoreductase [Candidatus Omnitrophica bacterium]|nr:NAD(P)/FAD-dependent oxidoreductase [Candidatus Omnitrophota bacterium]MDD5487925.1 NAD(P)/FAD-dependent oxidoreductase [Candidatus Omnitrophota bacterium]